MAKQIFRQVEALRAKFKPYYHNLSAHQCETALYAAALVMHGRMRRLELNGQPLFPKPQMPEYATETATGQCAYADARSRDLVPVELHPDVEAELLDKAAYLLDLPKIAARWSEPSLTAETPLFTQSVQ